MIDGEELGDQDAMCDEVMSSTITRVRGASCRELTRIRRGHEFDVLDLRQLRDRPHPGPSERSPAHRGATFGSGVDVDTMPVPICVDCIMDIVTAFQCTARMPLRAS